MKVNLFLFSMMSVCILTTSGQTCAGERGEGRIQWVEGYITASGEGTAAPSGNRVKDQLRAVRAATLLAQRALLETVKELKIDSETKVQNKMVQGDVITTRIEGTIQGAEIVRQNVRWEGETPVAAVELRICLSGVGGCKSDKSIVNALNLDPNSEQANAPGQRLSDIAPGQVAPAQKAQEPIYDSGRPVTGIIFNLQGLNFERVLLPVVIAIGDGNKPITVYSIKSVEPQVIRTHGVVRYADSVEQARQNTHLGDNPMIVQVSGITRENMIAIGLDTARMIHETTRHGNNYLKNAKVIIAAK